MPPESFSKIAVITSAHGIRGEVKLRLLIEDAEDLLRSETLCDAHGRALFSLKITGKSKGDIIAIPSTISDRNAAELLKGKEVFVPASVLPELGEGEFYQSEFTGLEARTSDGKVYGKVTGIFNFGAGDVIEFDNGEMLPFKAPWLGDVFIDQGYLIVTPAEYIEGEK